MRYIKVSLTKEEFKFLEENLNGIPKQVYCKKKILGEAIKEPNFENKEPVNPDKPDFYFNVQFRLSPKERAIVDELKGDMTLQEFCRKAVLNKKIISLDELKKIKYHISKIGNNINQIAKVANQTKDLKQKQDIDRLIKSFNMLTENIEIINKTIKERLD